MSNQVDTIIDKGERTSNNVNQVDDGDIIRRSIVINLDNNGQINVRFDGNFSLYEVLGLYTASFLDVVSRYFIAPSVVSGIAEAGLGNNVEIDMEKLQDITEVLASLKKAFGS